MTEPATTPEVQVSQGVRATSRSDAVPAAGQPWRIATDQAGPAASLPQWPAGWRTAALARLDAAGLPDDTDEEWRYTSLRAYAQRWSAYLAAPRQAASQARPVAAVGAPAEAGPGAAHLQVIDGVLVQPADPTPAGLSIGSLRQLPPGLKTRAEALLRQSQALAPESLVDLNSALVADVILVATAAGSNVEATPVHIHLQGSGAPAFGQPRVLVDVAAGSRLTLTLEHSGANGTLSNAVVHAWVGEAGQLNLTRVQGLPDDGMLTDTNRIELAADASARIASVDLGGVLSRQSMTVVLAGARASASLDGLFLADGRRHIDTRTRLEHRAPDTTSRESFRGLADGHGRGVFNGKIIVMPGAAGSNAALTNRNLLLAPTAEIDTKPELEIYVDDVRCSHGATTGQLDANALFYLRSRGLDPAAARQVLTAAFLREGLGGIATPEVRARLDARLQDKLGGTFGDPGTTP